MPHYFSAPCSSTLAFTNNLINVVSSDVQSLVAVARTGGIIEFYQEQVSILLVFIMVYPDEE